MASDLPLITIFFALLFLPNSTFSAVAPQSSPSPSPPRAISPPPPAPEPSHKSPPAPAPSHKSPPAPAPSHKSPPAPALSPKSSPAPPPAPADQGKKTHLGDLDESGGMSGGKKAGIAVGVIAAGCVVGLAAVVYKKRQRNIRRARYSYTDQRDFS
ncbi:sulfated surface glycoprotein 185-like protein [Salvia divinorum]|uniref:Sulfated surface glycoprotein 185-like protein n=1 Tax=Salvia divinorum TaxID=28513 RepID=A0ABD1HTI0_SALDI